MPPKRSAHGARPTLQAAKKQNVENQVKLTQKQIHQNLPQKQKDQYNKIFYYLDQRKYKEVIDICESILELAPTHCDAMGMKGYALYYIQPKFHDEMKHYLTEQQLANKAKPLGIQLRSYALQTIRKAIEIANKESHIPYQLLSNISKIHSEYQTQFDNLKIILSLPSHENNQTFNRELGNNLLMLGKYDQAFNQMMKPIVQNGDNEQREMYELTAVVDNFLGYEEGQIKELLSKQTFDQFCQLALQNREKIERNEKYNNPGSGPHNVSLAEQSQLTAFKLFYHEIELHIAKIMESGEKLSQEDVNNVKQYLNYLKSTLKDEKLLDKELLYKKVIKLMLKLLNYDFNNTCKRFKKNLWTLDGIIEISNEADEEHVEQLTEKQATLDLVFEQEYIELFDEAFQFLFDRNSNDSELFMAYVQAKQLGYGQALELLNKYKQRQLPIIYNQLKYFLNNQKESNGLIEFVDGVKKARTGEILNIVARTCEVNGVSFKKHYNTVYDYVVKDDPKSNLAISMNLQKDKTNIKELVVSKLLICDNQSIKTIEVIDEYINQLKEYDKERLKKNLVRNEDDKNEVILPPVPQFQDAEIDALINKEKEKIQIETWQLLNVWKGIEEAEINLSKLFMCLEVRDRAPNVHYAKVLAKYGNFNEALSVYQKFVPRNNSLLYLLEYQEMKISIAMLYTDFNQVKLDQKTSILDIENDDDMKVAQICFQIAIAAQILSFINDQIFYYPELYNQLGIARCEREVSVRSIQNGVKLLLERPIVKQVFQKLQGLIEQLKQCDPEKVQEILFKYQDKYYELFQSHIRMDPPEYGRIMDDDYFQTLFCKQISQGTKVQVPKPIIQLQKRAVPFGVMQLQIPSALK